MPNQQVTQSGLGSQLDQDVVNLAKSIRRVESNDNFQARGKSGEYGAYQFMPSTWSQWSKQYLGRDVPLQSATPEQQNEVAYKKIKELKDKGFDIGQVASSWNAGEGNKNAYITGFKGVNAMGVEYDTGAYAKKVAETYQQLKGAPVSQMTQTQPKDSKSFGQKAVEFAFPILEEKERTPLQTVGDLGLSALWFVPGLGMASGALRGATLGTKVGATIAAGAGTGYAADVLADLSEGKSDSSVFKPGLGTALGGGIAGVGAKLATRYSPQGVIKTLAKDNNQVFKQSKKGALELSEAFSKEHDPGLLAAQKGINIKNLVDAENVAYDTLGKSAEVIKDAQGMNKVLTEALAKIDLRKPVSQIESELIAKVPKNYPERVSKIQEEMSLLRQQYGETPTVSDINEWKQRAWNKSKFVFGDTSEVTEAKRVYRMIGNKLKTDVQDLAKQGGLKDVEKFNDLVGQHFDLAEFLERAHGTKAKGGRLGNLLTQGGLQTVGGMTGAFGAGPIGAIAGLIAGHYGAKALTAMVRWVEGSPIKSAILKRIQQEEPEILQRFKQFAEQDPQALKLIKEQLSLFDQPQQVQGGLQPTSLLPKEQ